MAHIRAQISRNIPAIQPTFSERRVIHPNAIPAQPLRFMRSYACCCETRYGVALMWWQRMNAVMKDQGVTQAELARRSGLSVNCRAEIREWVVSIRARVLSTRSRMRYRSKRGGCGGKTTQKDSSVLSDCSEKGDAGASGVPPVDVPVYATAPTSLWEVMSLVHRADRPGRTAGRGAAVPRASMPFTCKTIALPRGIDKGKLSTSTRIDRRGRAGTRWSRSQMVT